ncbi:MAG: hypothetical protein AAB263_10985, partial [Planctomycetota bacterium]
RQAVFENNQAVYEKEAEGDFFWSYPILKHVISNMPLYKHLRFVDFHTTRDEIDIVLNRETEEWNKRLEIIRRRRGNND